MRGGEVVKPLGLRCIIVDLESIELPDQLTVLIGAWVRFVDPAFELVPELMDVLLPCPGFLLRTHCLERLVKK